MVEGYISALPSQPSGSYTINALLYMFLENFEQWGQQACEKHGQGCS